MDWLKRKGAENMKRGEPTYLMPRCHSEVLKSFMRSTRTAYARTKHAATWTYLSGLITQFQ